MNPSCGLQWNATGYHLTREGGHTHRRVIHAADATGKALSKTLVDALKQHPNIEWFENHIAVDLVTGNKMGYKTQRSHGAYVLKYIFTPVIRMCPQVTALPWPGGPVAVWLTWSSFNFTLPAYTILTPSRF